MTSPVADRGPTLLIMQRVAVVGSGGAGKSTFARALGVSTGLPVIHLDEHYWKPGWVEPSRVEWRIIQEARLTGDRWIVDGNYGSTLDVRLSRVDTVIILARRPSVCVAQELRRQLSNRGRAVQAPGCPERIDPKFLRWIWRYPRDSRPRLDAAIHDHGQHARVIELASRKDIDEFLRANG